MACRERKTSLLREKERLINLRAEDSDSLDATVLVDKQSEVAIFCVRFQLMPLEEVQHTVIMWINFAKEEEQ